MSNAQDQLQLQKRKNKLLWINAGHLSSPKGLSGRFHFRSNPLLPPESFEHLTAVSLGKNPLFGIPAMVTYSKYQDEMNAEMELDILRSAEEVLKFDKVDLWILREEAARKAPEFLLAAECLDRAVILAENSQEIGFVHSVGRYGEQFVAAISGEKGMLDLPLVSEYFDLTFKPDVDALVLKKSAAEIAELWEV